MFVAVQALEKSARPGDWALPPAQSVRKPGAPLYQLCYNWAVAVVRL